MPISFNAQTNPATEIKARYSVLSIQSIGPISRTVATSGNGERRIPRSEHEDRGAPPRPALAGQDQRGQSRHGGVGQAV